MSSSGRGGSHSNDVVRAALDYAAHGWAVFPVHGVSGGRCRCGMSDCSSPGKHPLTRRGVKDATTNGEAIARWWKRWPDANLGLASGRTSGVVVIDVDPPRGELSLRRLVDAGYELPETATVRTGSGGLHLYYVAPGIPVGNTAGRLPGVGLELPGIDLRAGGGYVVVPPSVHVSGSRYVWIHLEVELAGAPNWLALAEKAIEDRPTSPRVAAPGSSTPYGLAALSGELEELKSAPVGTRNHTLNRCAFRLGRLIAGGELDEVEVIGELRARALALEKDFQEFFEANPEFLLALGDYTSLHSQIVIHEDDGTRLVPDFFLEKLDSGLADMCDLKLPKVEIVRAQHNRVRFRSAVMEAVAQLDHYRNWFEDRSNRDKFRNRYGFTSYRPQAVIIMGRRQSFR